MARVIDPGTTDTLTERVAREAARWRDRLLDTGHRNPLLHWRDLRTGTLSLDRAHPPEVDAVLAGRGARISRLFPDPAAGADAHRRARALNRRSREHLEERGLHTLHVAFGLATWTADGTAVPAAPVLLRPVRLVPTGPAHADHTVVPEGELALNETLAQHLEAAYGVRLDRAALADMLDGEIDTPEELRTVRTWLAIQAREVPGFAVVDRAVIGTFAYAKLPMVRDLEDVEALAAHDVVAALAGSAPARARVRGRALAGRVDPSDPDATPPDREHLVLDADSSQSAVVNAVLAGRDVVVDGPPGTGKSQTIANLIASLVARGQTVLFVAEKRAAIEAVTRRLDAVGLSDLVLDLHTHTGGRRRTAASLAEALDRVSVTPPVDRDDADRALVDLRGRLAGHAAALHDPHAPWGIGMYAAQAGIAALADAPDTGVRLAGEPLRALDPAAVRRAQEDVARYLHLDGPAAMAGGSAWSAAAIDDPAAAEDALATARRLRDRVLPDALSDLAWCADATGLPHAPTVAAWAGHRDLWAEAAAVAAVLDPAVFAADPGALHARLDRLRRGRLTRLVGLILSRDLRAARRELTALAAVPGTDEPALLAALGRAVALAARWRELAPGGRPAVAEGAPRAGERHDAAMRDLAALGALLGRDPAALPAGEAVALTDRLAGDDVTVARLPELRTLRTRIGAAGLEPLVAALHETGVPADRAADAVRRAWLASVAEHIRLRAPSLSGFSAAELDAAAAAFREADRAHLADAAARVRRLWAERVTEVRDAHPEQASLVLAEARRKRGHRPLRTLVADAPDVLLALKPCWAMSPLRVSETLPPDGVRFDVVVIDEASQVSPADAVPAVMRGNRLVVAGDDRQLPPTAFFTSADDDEDPDPASGTAGLESVLDAAATFLPRRTLRWHYRSRDERLIAFSNAHVYGGALTTFPSPDEDPPLRHVLVDYGRMDTEDSSAAEVERVARLVVAHAESRPDESLGVITLGRPHAERVEERVRALLADRPDLADVFAETRPEPFFVKNLERVQGDERDAIILTVGYGRAPDGGVRHTFGPLTHEGGERRLNVAVTRARRRMTVVSAFGSADLDPGRSSSAGATMLRRFRAYAEGRGAAAAAPGAGSGRDALEDRIADLLRARGLHVRPGLGSSAAPVDLAVGPAGGPPLVAVELDGCGYAASPTVRDRERLRPQVLEGLGWVVHRSWTPLWWQDPDAAAERVVRAVDAAVAAAGARAPAVADDSPAPEANRTTEAPAPVPPAPRPARPPCPVHTRRASIRDYEHSELVQLARWVAADGLLRTEEETMRAMVDVLGFRRLGMRIEQALLRAVRAA